MSQVLHERSKEKVKMLPSVYMVGFHLQANIQCMHRIHAG